MDKCSCYREHDTWVYNSVLDPGGPLKKQIGLCYGTKEREKCLCKGDTAKCDFYPEKRVTAEQSPEDRKIDKIIQMINGLDLSGYIKDEESRETIVKELLELKLTLKERSK